MAFRLPQPSPTYWKNDGTLNAGGSLNFYVTGTTTPKNVYSDETLGTSLGSTITLDSNGRHSEDPWLAEDFEYRIIEKDSDGVTLSTRDNVRSADTAAAIVLPDPASGTDGQVLTTDGIDYYLADNQAVPDPSGHSGQVLGNDGANLLWQDVETFDEDSLPGGITQGSTSLQVGKFLIQTGTGTVPTNTGGVTANVAVTFGTAYATLLGVQVTATGSAGSTPQGAIPTLSVVGSTSGFTAYAYAGDEHDDPPGWKLTASTPFTYVAFGLVA
jgi:hypothetical protein